MRGKAVSFQLTTIKVSPYKKTFLFHTHSYHRIEFQLVIQVDLKHLDDNFLCASLLYFSKEKASAVLFTLLI